MGYWEYTPVEELHRRSQFWLSETAFWKEELKFMRKLVRNHLLYFMDEERHPETTRLTQGLLSLKNDLRTIEDNIREHESHLKTLLLARTERKEKAFRREHGSLEHLIGQFTEDYKTTKKKLFREADAVLKEEKVQRLISLAG
ncbi:hypothetical protein CRP01_39115 [Flavilitoribacter nigricans DSM 23189 = NBRC 102662]|uniref:Uncharacterized protein n=2 Tax=Flavilitoribacter TaxID=2762562 RepID=A0A2D0MY09_FLAN2|nr:hypothetical protein CRP01_39115 [Flavilitoribacter nigricans DSM 23189 = NBRC 102662]